MTVQNNNEIGGIGDDIDPDVEDDLHPSFVTKF